MREITVTTYGDGVAHTVDADAIDYVKPGLGECELFFADGSSLRVGQTFEEVSRRIRDAE